VNESSAPSVLSWLSILLPPLAAGVLVLLSHVTLGVQVLRRGVVFMDLAIAQVAALGVLMAGSLGGAMGAPWWAGSLAALAGAGLVAWLGARWPARREALIGLVYVTAAALAILWVSADPHGAQKLKAMVSGDVLWVTWPGLLPLAVATGLFLLLQALPMPARVRSTLFYPGFAVLVSLSVPLLGLYLVFATLIVPALAAGDGTGWRGLRAVAFGSGGYAVGLGASLWLDLPSGPCVVLALLLTGAMAGAMASAMASAMAGTTDRRMAGDDGGQA
jgi:zinc/manganese transport system permease protein